MSERVCQYCGGLQHSMGMCPKEAEDYARKERELEESAKEWLK